MAAEREDRGRTTAPPVDAMGTWVAPLVAEAIGVLAVCYAGIGSIMAFGGAVQGEPGQSAELVGIALAPGLATGLMVAAAGHVSGGVYNPAVTLALVIAGKLRIDKAIGYVVAQLVGGLIGALLIRATFPEATADLANLGTPAPGPDIAAGKALLAEIVATFFLVYVIFGTAVDARGPRTIAPLAIGLTIAVDILAVGPISGAAMNPARWFGPAVVEGFWENGWIYWVGPAIGAAIAALLYYYVYLQGRDAV